MKNKVAAFFIFSAILFFGSAVNSYAVLGDYVRSYDISWLEWQILNWTTAFRGTTTPAEPGLAAAVGAASNRTWGMHRTAHSGVIHP